MRSIGVVINGVPLILCYLGYTSLLPLCPSPQGHKAQESANATMKKLSPATGQQAQIISANSHLYQLPSIVSSRGGLVFPPFVSLIGQHETGLNVQPIEMLSHLELHQTYQPTITAIPSIYLDMQNVTVQLGEAR
ncbi:hypothetical protein [truncated ORF], partial [Penicillium rubens Wisconsin 54-1255]